MNAPILHHYPVSPFAEKIRVILAYKKIAWQSVRIPMVMPKPDLVALTGGYRRTPVLQTGADIWCDTALIARMAALGNGESTEISAERALEIAVRRTDPRAGTVVVHFPRFGFQMARA